MNESGIPSAPIDSSFRKKGKFEILLILIFIISLALNIFLFVRLQNSDNVLSGQDFSLLNLRNSEPGDTTNSVSGILHYNGLMGIINSEISSYNATGKVGVFVQDIGTGAWLGINEEGDFTPASLLKIPIALAIMKKVDRGEIKLDDTITVTEQDVDTLYDFHYAPLQVGANYTISDLLRRMISLSDNTAKNALKEKLSLEEIDAVFVHVGIRDPYVSEDNQTLSPRGYTRIFKALYYSTYLSPASSERLLDLATNTPDEDLLSQNLPSQIVVAHKLGIIENEFLHDCGIVYHPKNPYFICIMTKGLSSNDSSELIPKISKDVFDFVDSKS